MNRRGSRGPAPDGSFSLGAVRLTRPAAMDTERYVYGVVPVDGRDAWALFCACAAGGLSGARRLLGRDPALVNAQYWYQFPIHMAVREGHAAVVELLLQAGADPGESRYTYNSWDKLLAVAAERGHREVDGLLRQAMAARFGYDSGFEPLAAAIRDRDRERTEALLAADPDLVRAADALGNNLLHWAAITRQLDLVDRFHELGADIDARRADGRAPVQVAVDGDYWFRARKLPEDAIQDPWVVARHLLDRGAARDFTLVCRMGDLEGAREILAADPGAANRLDPARRSPLTAAVQAGHLELALLLLDHRADPAQPEDLAPRGAALHEAAAANRLDLAALLLDHEADPDAEVDSSGDCWFIVEWSHPEECGPMQELLRRRGATPTPPDSPEEMERALLEGYPASGNWLFMANLLNSKDADLHDLFLDLWEDAVADLVPGDVWGGDVPSPELLSKLLEAGLDPNRPNWVGRTFLHVAAEKGAVEAAAALLQVGADLEAVELEHGGTPLAAAARAGAAEMVVFLLEKGADPDAPAGSPWATARARAREGDSARVRELLA